ncbi:MAG: ATP-binding protein [Proteobacteria bacterium]|nr:ATP-binding protein [Pseudomonadota bacterium]
MTRNLQRAHALSSQGEMMVESELGQGCHFIIRLPVET